MKKNNTLGNILLLITAAIWGSAFVAQRMVSGTGLEPFSFCAIRYAIAAVGMFPVLTVSQKKLGRPGVNPFDIHSYTGKPDTPEDVLRFRRRETFYCGVISGICMFGGTVCQQIGLVTVTASKAGFLTAMYVVLVPIGAFLVFRKKPSVFAWIGAFVGLIGLFFLSFAGALSGGLAELGGIAPGDLITLLGACFWTLQILTIDHYIEMGADGIRLAQIEYTVTAVLSAIGAALFENPTSEAAIACIWPILYTAILSTVVGFTLQIIGQKYTDPTPAALIMSLESVFGALAGALLLHELLSGTELIGSVVLLSGVVISQIPVKAKKAA